MDRTNSTEMTKDGGVHLETADDGLKGVDGVKFPIIENRTEKEKELVRKIDLRMMPLMMLICKKTPPPPFRV